MKIFLVFRVLLKMYKTECSFQGSTSNIDNRSETIVHAKFDACITFVTIILLSNWTIRLL